jgi:maltose O-acetyltransferase
MTEKEKMLAGELYSSRDPELLGRYHEVRKLLLEYNHLPSKNLDKKEHILASILGDLGENVWIESPFFCDYGEQIRIGSNVFINYNCIFLDSNSITIGDNTLIGPAVQVYTATHPLKAEERINTDPSCITYLTSSKPVKIGRNCWIGGGAILMPGVSIGDHTTIGAGSVVTKSLPENCFAAGNPCNIKKEL